MDKEAKRKRERERKREKRERESERKRAREKESERKGRESERECKKERARERKQVSRPSASLFCEIGVNCRQQLRGLRRVTRGHCGSMRGLWGVYEGSMLERRIFDDE
jgi:hypothetical protein